LKNTSNSHIKTFHETGNRNTAVNVTAVKQRLLVENHCRYGTENK